MCTLHYAVALAVMLVSQEVWAGCGGLRGETLRDCQKAEQQMLQTARGQAITYLNAAGRPIAVREGMGEHLCQVAGRDGTYSTEQAESSQWSLGNGARLELKCQRGKVNGLGRLLDEGGAVLTTCSWKDDRRHGAFTRYEEGKLEGGGRFVDGKKTGRWVSYFPDGKLKDSFEYADGRMEGLARRYFPSGKVNWEATFHHDQRLGIETQWSEEGKKQWEFVRKPGGDTQRQYDSTGNLQTESAMEGGKWVMRIYKDGVLVETR